MLSVLPAPDSPLLVVSIRSIAAVNYVRDQDALVLSFFAHVNPRSFGYGVDMGRVLIATLASVLMYNCVRV